MNPLLYFNDMIMMLYLYVINGDKYLPSNALPISTGLLTKLDKIEQSGFGEILGFRRENISLENDIPDSGEKPLKEELTQLIPSQIKKLDSCESIKSLLCRRKKEFLAPLKYSYDKALF